MTTQLGTLPGAGYASSDKSERCWTIERYAAACMLADRQPAQVSDLAEYFAEVKRSAAQIRQLLGDELQSVPWNIRLQVQAELDQLDAACNHGLQSAAGLWGLHRIGERRDGADST